MQNEKHLNLTEEQTLNWSLYFNLTYFITINFYKTAITYNFVPKSFVKSSIFIN